MTCSPSTTLARSQNQRPLLSLKISKNTFPKRPTRPPTRPRVDDHRHEVLHGVLQDLQVVADSPSPSPSGRASPSLLSRSSSPGARAFNSFPFGDRYREHPNQEVLPLLVALVDPVSERATNVHRECESVRAWNPFVSPRSARSNLTLFAVSIEGQVVILSQCCNPLLPRQFFHHWIPGFIQDRLDDFFFESRWPSRP